MNSRAGGWLEAARRWWPARHRRGVYIAGPMTGCADDNRPLFAAAAADLARGGWRAVNPHTLHRGPRRMTWADYMRRDVPVMLAQPMVAMLPGWQASRGAQYERAVALACGLVVVDLARGSDGRWRMTTHHDPTGAWGFDQAAGAGQIRRVGDQEIR